MTKHHRITKSPAEQTVIKTENANCHADVECYPDFVRIRFAEANLKLHFDHSFHDKTLFYQRIAPAGQALLKACTNKQRSIGHVLDLTAGWGIDSFILAQHGRQVTMLEQNPLLAAILSSSLEKAGQFTHTRQAARRITLIHSNSADYLRLQCNRDDFQCIYLDPMFPERRSGAKPGKDMQLLQKLTTNLDIETCFELAMEKAANRVVVKRPAKAAALTAIRPDLSFREKSVRFDIYLTG